MLEYQKKVLLNGGILSPLLSNIVLNELDWWIASQWEFFPLDENKRKNKNYYLKNSKLKRCYIVRYADDFKIICKKKSDAEKLYIATKNWLKERLGFEISPEKSKIVNLRKHYSEFLGFKIKVKQKRKKYVIRSCISDKAKAKIKANCNKASIEYNDNLLSIYLVQKGKCRICGEELELEEIYCHHVTPKELGGTDEYKNLIIVHTDIHKLIHSTSKNEITELISKFKLDTTQIEKLNKFRKKLQLELV